MTASITLCMCGCGSAVSLAKRTQTRLGHRQGEPLRYLNGHASTRDARPVAERFYAHVNTNGPIPAHCPELGPCHLWTGTRDSRGYGRLKVAGKELKAHRLGWELVNGPMPSDRWACHHCDNPPCVRDTHVYSGTPSQNALDSYRHGRRSRGGGTGRGGNGKGERNTEAKLTAAQVEEIRKTYVPRVVSQRLLAGRYGVAQGTIGAVITGRSWK